MPDFPVGPRLGAGGGGGDRGAGWRPRPCTPAPSVPSAIPSRSSPRASSSARSVGAGRRAGGVSSAVARGSWVPAELQPRSRCRRLGALEPWPPRPGTRLVHDPGASCQRPPRGRQSRPRPGGPGGVQVPATFRGPGGGADGERQPPVCAAETLGWRCFHLGFGFGLFFFFFPSFAWFVLSFHREAGVGFCTFLLGT